MNPEPLAGPWFTSRQAQAYIPCKSLRAVYAWCQRHGIVRRFNGSIAKRDIDRVLNQQRPKRQMAKASLQNLRLRHVHQHQTFSVGAPLTTGKSR